MPSQPLIATAPFAGWFLLWHKKSEWSKSLELEHVRNHLREQHHQLFLPASSCASAARPLSSLFPAHLMVRRRKTARDAYIRMNILLDGFPSLHPASSDCPSRVGPGRCRDASVSGWARCEKRICVEVKPRCENRPRSLSLSLFENRDPAALLLPYFCYCCNGVRVGEVSSAAGVSLPARQIRDPSSETIERQGYRCVHPSLFCSKMMVRYGRSRSVTAVLLPLPR